MILLQYWKYPSYQIFFPFVGAVCVVPLITFAAILSPLPPTELLAAKDTTAVLLCEVKSPEIQIF